MTVDPNPGAPPPEPALWPPVVRFAISNVVALGLALLGNAPIAIAVTIVAGLVLVGEAAFPTRAASLFRRTRQFVFASLAVLALGPMYLALFAPLGLVRRGVHRGGRGRRAYDASIDRSASTYFEERSTDPPSPRPFLSAGS
ncbi:MAG: hypothetical protein AAGF12_20330 [Myxococcota bacterium]